MNKLIAESYDEFINEGNDKNTESQIIQIIGNLTGFDLKEVSRNKNKAEYANKRNVRVTVWFDNNDWPKINIDIGTAVSGRILPTIEDELNDKFPGILVDY